MYLQFKVPWDVDGVKAQGQESEGSNDLLGRSEEVSRVR